MELERRGGAWVAQGELVHRRRRGLSHGARVARELRAEPDHRWSTAARGAQADLGCVRSWAARATWMVRAKVGLL